MVVPHRPQCQGAPALPGHGGPERPLRILFLTPRLPGLALQGYRVRAYHQLRLLARRHHITLVSFDDAEPPPRPARTAAEFCERVIMVPLRLGQVARSLLRRGLTDLPVQSAIYETSGMRRAIRDALKGGAFDLVHVQLARMAPYLDEFAADRRVVDFVDALSENMRRRYRHDRSPWRWAAYLESRRLGRYERAICACVDRAVIGSALDRQALGAPPGLVTVPSGVDLGTFPFRRDGRQADTVIFSGNMSYFPNVHAVQWFSESVWPRLKQMIPGVRFQIVGARPHRSIRRLAERDPSITVSGFVEDVHGYLSRAAIAVAPMLAGSGQQLKVLEAMASGTPVVSTPLAADSIEAKDGEHLLSAEGAEAFAERAARLLKDPDLAHRLAANGRRLVEERYTWDRSVAQLEAIYRSLADGVGARP